MAGTGHPYEIVNLHHVKDFLMERGKYLRTSATKDWLTSKKVIKFFTKEMFTDEVAPENFDMMLNVFDQAEVEHLQMKNNAGETLRLFSKIRTEAIGPDLPHMVDWLLHIERNDQKRLSKLYKMTVEQVSDAAAKWTSWTADDIERGREEVVLKCDNGMFWMELLDEKAIKAEGSALNHCIGGYGHHLKSGNYRLFSLRGESNYSIISVAIYHNILRSQWWLQEARGHSNNPVPVQCEQALADLMNHLNVQGPEKVSGTGVTVGADGIWRRVINSRREIRWQGYICYVDVSNMLVMSNHAPGLYLAEIIFSDEKLIVEDGSDEHPVDKIDPKAIVKTTGDRHFHINEQRAVAELMNRLGTSKYTSRDPFIVQAHGKAIPLLDSYERRWLAGAECIVKTKGDPFYNDPLYSDVCGKALYEIVVPHSRDLARTLVTIGGVNDSYLRKSYGAHVRTDINLKAALVKDPDRMNSSETIRVLSVLNELGTVTDILNEKATDVSFKSWQEKFKPRRIWKTDKWVSLTIDGKTDVALTDSGKGGYWLHCEGHAEFFDEENKSLALRQWNKSDLQYIETPFHTSVEKYKVEAVAFLNKHGWTPTPEYFWNNASPFDRNEYYRSDIMGTVHKIIYFLHGEWRLAETDDELVKAFTTKLPRKRKYEFTPAEASAILRLLPMDYVSDEMDEAFVAALSSWSKSVNARSCLGYFPRTQKDFIINLQRLYDRVPPAAQKKCSQFLSRFLLEKTKGKKTFMMNGNATEYLLLLYPHLSNKDFIRVVKKASSSSWKKLSDNKRSPLPEWRKMHDRVSSISKYEAADFTRELNWVFFHFDANETFKTDLITLDEANLWGDLVEVSKADYFADRIEDSCKALLEQMERASAMDTMNDWSVPITKIQLALKFIAEAEARAEQKKQEEAERHRIWMTEFKARCRPADQESKAA